MKPTDDTGKKGTISIKTGGSIRHIAKKEYRVDAKKTTHNAAKSFQQKSGKEKTIRNEDKVTQVKPKSHGQINIIKLDGPFDENNRKVTLLEKEKYYIYRVVFDRKPSKLELNKLKWAHQYDEDKPEELPEPTGKGWVSIKNKICQINKPDKVRMYAYFKEPEKRISVETPVLYTEAIMVAAANDHEATSGNKLMFIAQAVRTLLINKSSFDKATLVYFTQGYNNEEVSAVKKSLSNKYTDKEIKYLPVSTVNELIQYINKDIVNRRIKTIHFYSHGLPSKITFYLRGSLLRNIDGFQTLSYDDIKKIKRNNFLNDAIIYSYACRTGNAQENPAQNDFTPYYTVTYFSGKADFTERYAKESDAQRRYSELKTNFSTVFLGRAMNKPEDIHIERSLAQKLANHLNLVVWAYLTRSDYSATWLNWEKSPTRSKIKDTTVEWGHGHLAIWQDGSHALWDSNGALQPVKAGTTPWD